MDINHAQPSNQSTKDEIAEEISFLAHKLFPFAQEKNESSMQSNIVTIDPSNALNPSKAFKP